MTFSITAFILLVTITVDLLTLELVWTVTRGTDNLPDNFDVSAPFRCRFNGKRIKLTT